MKAIQYITDDARYMHSFCLRPSVPMAGAKKICISDTALGSKFKGFGVALTGSSCYLLNTMSEEKRTEFLKSIYSQEGLNLGAARLTIGSSDYSAEIYSYDDTEGDVGLKDFSIERDKEYIIPMIKEVLKIRPDLYIFASPWSPPGWMKTGGSMCGGYMRAEYVGVYADYIVKYLKAYKDCGIRISAVTVQNEPETQQNGNMPACIWHPDIEAAFIKELKGKLCENGMDVEVWMHDHNFSGVDRVLWELENHEGLDKACGGAAFHYYDGGIELTEKLHEKYPDIPRHFTEGGPRLYDNYATDVCKWSIMMAKVLNCGFESFTGWNLMLDEKGGPNIGPFFCGGLVTKNSVTGELSFSGQYKAFRHIAHFMEKDADIFPVKVGTNALCMFAYPKFANEVIGTAVKNPDGKLVLLLANPNGSKVQTEVTAGGSNWYIELLPNSVSTVVFE